MALVLCYKSETEEPIRGFPKLNLSQIELIELIEQIHQEKIPFVILYINIHVFCLQCAVSLINNLLLLVIISICIYIIKIGLVTENFIPNYQSLLFKSTQLA